MGGAGQLGLRLQGELLEILGVSLRHKGPFVVCRQLVDGELADRFDEMEAGLSAGHPAGDETLVDQGGEGGCCSSCRIPGGRQGEASGEGAHPSEVFPFGVVEQVVAPGDRVTQCPVAGRTVAWSSHQTV